MGAFYGSVHAKADDHGPLIPVLERLARENELRFLLAPSRRGWVNIYPSGNGQDAEVGQLIAEQLPEAEHILQLLVHDDDVFCYWYYRRGKLVDQYNSSPDYFGEVSAQERSASRGDPDACADLLGSDSKLSRLRKLLAAATQPGESGTPGAGLASGAEQFINTFQQLAQQMEATADASDTTAFAPAFASEPMAEFAKLLNIPNVPTAYEYLIDGEIDDIVGFKKFIRIPRGSSPAALRKAERVAERQQLKELLSSGVLLKEIHPKAGMSPSWCVGHGDMASLVLAWSSYCTIHKTSEVVRYASPWTGPPIPIGIAVHHSVHRLTTSHSGRFLAAGHASGRWITEVFELRDGRRVLEVDLPSNTSPNLMVFSSDESRLIVESGGRIDVVSIPEGKIESSCKIPLVNGVAALSADERFIVTSPDHGLLGVYDVSSGRLAAQPSFPDPLLVNMPERAQDIALKFIPNPETAFALNFSADGQYLLCTTSYGLRVYAWRDIRDGAAPLPEPIVSAYITDTQAGNSGFGFPIHLYRPIYVDRIESVLYGASDGKLRYLHVPSGNHGVMIEVPGQGYVYRLATSDDGENLFTGSTIVAERSSMPGPAYVWNLRALCKNAGIEYS